MAVDIGRRCVGGEKVPVVAIDRVGCWMMIESVPGDPHAKKSFVVLDRCGGAIWITSFIRLMGRIVSPQVVLYIAQSRVVVL